MKIDDFSNHMSENDQDSGCISHHEVVRNFNRAESVLQTIQTLSLFLIFFKSAHVSGRSHMSILPRTQRGKMLLYQQVTCKSKKKKYYYLSYLCVKQVSQIKIIHAFLYVCVE